MLGVYVHVPFCESRCNYCAFSSFVRNDEIDRYINALTKEISSFNGDKIASSIYFGGGTPSILEKSQFERIFQALKSTFTLTDDCEITIECNPNTFTADKGRFYRQMGVNRISFGVQSLDDNILKFLSRRHSAAQALSAIKCAQECGFENISADMLIGVNKNTDDFLKQVELLCSQGVKHISAYMLQIEEGTPLEKMVMAQRDLLPDEDESIDQYNGVAKLLKKSGFERYEVSNFAVSGFECRHNVNYWTGGDYVGFGLSAHSYIGGRRFANANTFEKYYRGVLALDEQLSTRQLQEEHIMLGLRCKYGVDKKYLFGLGYDISKNENLPELLDKKIIFDCGGRLKLNEEYYGVNNLVIIKLLPD